MRYVKQIIPDIIINLLSLLLLGTYLSAMGVAWKYIVLPLFIWVLIFSSIHLIKYRRILTRFEHIKKTMGMLDKKYLIAEVIRPVDDFYETFYLELLKSAERSMLEEIGYAQRMYENYKEYIEQWVHEIKRPITSLKLKDDNDTEGALACVKPEAVQIENLVEQVLFFARSENVEKDFVVKQVALREIVQAAILKNRYFLRKYISVEVEIPESTVVYSDGMWLEFILGQIILNTIQYRKASDAMLHISIQEEQDTVILKIADNGIGIPDSELGRVFDKAFTGSNGRQKGNSTGLGLYLCKTLCIKLEHTISISSIEGEGTAVVISFVKQRNLTDL